MTRHETDAPISLRRAALSDAEACGRIVFDAFKAIADQHRFPPDFGSPGEGLGLIRMLLWRPRVHGIVAEMDGRVVGSNFLDERSLIVGLGPISVDPAVQNRQVGRRLMQAALERVRDEGRPGVRLVQSAYHGRSLALYTTLGFRVREGLACLQGPPIATSVTGRRVRPAREADVDACDHLCRRVHGHDRHGEVVEAVAQGAAQVVEHDGRISGYATGLAFFAHAVGEGNEDVMALIGSAPAFGGPGILVPLRNAPLLEWCLVHRLKIVQVMTLMTRGLYNEPAGAYLPSVLY
jgi:GNAT superfamily N-acetyltransferase